MTSASFLDWVASRAAEMGAGIALDADGRSWTWSQLDEETSRIARKLASLGVTRGDRVATFLGNGSLAAILPHAALRLGASLVPLNTRLSEREIDWQVRDASPRVLLRQGDLDNVAESDVKLRLKHESTSTLAIIYTSGTTGNPKGAMLTVGNFWWSAIGSSMNLGTRSDDRWLACLPLFHVGGLSIIMRSAIQGTAAVVHESFDPAKVNAAIDGGVTIVSVVAVMLERMIDERNETPYPETLRCVLLGGGPASISLLERCARLRIPVVQTYGLTEACSQVATLSPENALARTGSSGKPLYPNTIRIEPPDREEGEILVRGPIVMKGYYNNTEATRRAVVDGWLHTGDVGRLDKDGFLHVLDRRDDLIVTGGENVYPAEVESALMAHPSVIEAGVIGMSDDEWGQSVVAVVRTSVPIDASELQAYCRATLASYKVPRDIRFVDEPLPRTASGKIRRASLREATPQ